jgi:subtilisin family serine protease
MTATRARLLAGLVLPLSTLAACGGGESGGSVASTPTPTPVSVTSSATPTPTPTPAVNYDTAEYRRSNAAAQAQALTAYNAGATGAGVLVGVIDSGVDTTSSEFTGRISPLSADFAGSRGLQDEGGHGTAVSDVLLGARNDTGIHGVAFNATLLALRTDTPGTCASATGGSDGCSHNDNNIAAALDAAVSARARVVNISLGGTPANNRLRAAIDRATAAGTIIVIAAGNEGVTNPVAANNPDMLAQVANDPIARGLVIIAGATDSTGGLADFSNRAGNGAANYLAALGSRVRAVDETGTSYLYSGTSFSAPVISGAVALIAQAFPNLTPAQIVALLYRSADDRGATGVDTVYGNGEINLARAFGPIGSLSLPGSAVPVSLSANATLGGSMGDAVKGSLSAVIRDEFGRDFGVDLAPTLARTAVRRTLASGLVLSGRNLSASGGRTSFALAIDDREPARPLMLGSREAGQARVLAGSMAIAVSKSLKLGFGGGVGADGLLQDARAPREPAFLVTDRSLDRAPLGAFAVRQNFGRIGVTLAAESGQMQLWQRGDVGPMADGVRRYAYSQLSAGLDRRAGPVALTAKLARLDERATVLGSRFGAALGGNGAVSWFADVGATVSPVENWRLSATWQRGWTGLGANSMRGHSVLLTQSLSGTVARDNLWIAGDSLALRYSEPLRVTGGGLDLLALGSKPQMLSLTPTGRERDWEAVYARPLGRGWLTANTYWRQQPGNYATAPEDMGAAVRYSFGF